MNDQPDRQKRRAAALPLAQAVLHAFGGANFANAIDKYREAQAALSADTRSPDEVLWRRAFANALGDALRSARVHVQQTDEELAAAIEDELAEALDAMADFHVEQLIEPTTFSAYPPMRERFPAFVRRIDPAFAADEQSEHLRERLDTALKTGLYRVWEADAARFQPIADRLQGPIAEGFRRERQWQRHNDWIRSEFYGADVFSFETLPQPVKLKDVYIRLRCVWHEEVADGRAPERSVVDIDAERPRTRRAHVAKLHEQMHAWLASRRAADAVRIVAGGPGSGKSSFARAFATEVIDDTGWRVVFLPLQRVDLSGDLLDALRSLWDRTKNQGIGFAGPGDPLDWYGQGTAPCLLIFDGLDELAHSEHAATDLTSRFIHQLEKLLRDCASSTAPLKALVLGRTVAAGEARQAAGLALATLLHVLPLRPPTAGDLSLTEEHRGSRPSEEVVDDQGLLKAEDVDQRKVYWRQWQQVAGAAAEPEPPGLTDERLSGLTDEPLLLHLLIISGFLAPDRWQEAADNRNRVYAEIFSRVYERDRDEGKGVAPKVDRHGFFMLIECLGLASWPGGGRTFTAKAFREVRESHVKGPGSRELKEMPDTDVGTLVQFYAREDFDAAGYEFLHKSFGEYLIGRGLLAAAQRARRTLDEDGPDEAARHWVKIAGLAEITREILRFVRDEVRLMKAADAQELKEALEALMGWTLREGMPAQSVGDTSSFRLIEARQRCAEGALLAVLNACARKIAECNEGCASIMIAWPSPTALKECIARLRSAGSFNFVIAQCFSFQKFSNEFCDFRHDLRHQNLSSMDFSYSDLSYADIDSANCSFSKFIGAYFYCARLGIHIPSSAGFKSNLVSLPYNACGTNLTYANLSNANLRNARLFQTSLGCAVLHETILEEAIIAHVDFDHARIETCVFKGSVFMKTNLRNARIQPPEQIADANGDNETILPSDVSRPSHWGEDRF